MIRTPLVLVLALLGCAEPTARVGAPVVYGEDDRTEVYAHPNTALRAVAESAIAAQIYFADLDESDPGAIRVVYPHTLRGSEGLCDGERFADQITPAGCSGTLIDAQHLLTAAHCVPTAADCTNRLWVFGVRYVAEGVFDTLTENDVYRCARTLTDGVTDHAIIELDRPVVGHTPPPVRIEPSGLPLGTPLALIGYPSGLPMKIDSGGVVTSNAAALTHLTASLDAFDGSSGAGAFDHEGRLVALLSSGMTDYVTVGDCSVVNVIDPAPVGDGERLVYLRPALEAYCAAPGVDSPLCACGGPCVPPPAGDECAEAVELEPVDQTVSGTLAGYAASSAGSCGGDGPDRAYAFTLTEPTTLTAAVAGYDSVLYVRDACDGSELACNHDIDDTDRGSRVEVELDRGRHVLFVDTDEAVIGTFTLTLSFARAALPDAGSPATPDGGAAAEPDAGDPDGGAAAEPDAGEPPPETTGGCRVGRTSPPRSLPALLVGAALLVTRRRKSPRPPR